MKFGLFYQLPCAPDQSEAARYEETLEQIVRADELGFDVAHLAELHFYRTFSVMPTPLVVAGALARITRRIRLGIAVNLAPFHHPVRLAEEAATVDILSGGRLEFGAGRGTITLHFVGFDVAMKESRERFEEALAIITAAWTQERVSFAGKYYRVPDVAIVPKPLQKPHPPIRIAANSPETAAFAARGGYPIFVASPVNPMPRIYDHIRAYRQAACAAERGSGDVAALFPVYPASSGDAARNALEPSLMHYLHTIAEQVNEGQRLAGNQTLSPDLRAICDRIAAITYETAEATMALTGTSEDCLRRIEALHAQAPMDQLICWFNPGGLVPHRKVLAAMEQFAHEVMPAARALTVPCADT